MTGPKNRAKVFTNKGGYLCKWDPIAQKMYLVHRLIWYEAYGYWPERLDHINGKKQDNRLENLREVTTEQSAQNRVARTKYLSKCVYFDKSKGKYRVRVQASGKRHFIGLFDTEIEASGAAIAAIWRLHGAYAKEKGPAV